MREIPANLIEKSVALLCIKANLYLNGDIKTALKDAANTEENELSKDILEKLLLNADIAEKNRIPMCQDTGMTVIYADIGQEVHITGGSLTDAINRGVATGYEDGYLRKSVVADPINRINTNNNTPAVIYYNIVEGDKVKLTVAPKGFGSENMSRAAMLMPSDGIEGVKSFIIETVRLAGANPCPPIIVGVGVGGTLDKACVIAKQALLRPVGEKNSNPYWADVETELLERINSLGIGPAGFGGATTALAVHINTFATHIAGLPVAVNIGCHATRHCTEIV